MVIRTRDDALKALSEVLALDRRTQIVQITVKLAMCLTPESRQILFRAQEGLVQGKLDMRLKEHAAAIKAATADEEGAPAAELPVGKVAEFLATALEALKLAAVAWDVFPNLSQSFARWEVARAVLHFSDDIRRIIAQGTNPANRAASVQELANLLTRFRPWWHSHTELISQACVTVVERAPRTRWPVGARSLLDLVATTELRAMYAAKDVIPNQMAMIEPLTKIYGTLQQLLAQAYPSGLPEESALAE